AIIVARSAFESSLRYRSAVVFGVCERLEGREKEAALDVLTERLIPGRAAEVRRPAARELAATLVLALPLAEWSLKVSGGWPDDPGEDVAGDAWAGVVPLAVAYGEAAPAPDLRPGIEVAPAVVRQAAAQWRERAERNPHRFNRVELSGLIAAARERAAGFLGIDPARGVGAQRVGGSLRGARLAGPAARR